MKQKYRACDLIDWYNSVVSYPVSGYHLAKEDDTWVYLFFNPISGLYKIGKTKDLYRRRAQIQSISGCATEIVLAFSPQSHCDESVELMESLLHRFFWDRRKRGNGLTCQQEMFLQSAVYFGKSKAKTLKTTQKNTFNLCLKIHNKQQHETNHLSKHL